MRWGILGSGVRAREIAKQISSNGHQLSTVASRSEAQAQAMAELYGSQPDTYDGILNRKDLDALYIANETQNHFEVLMRAISSNHKVFCTKPICCSQREYEELKRLGGFLVHDVWINWHPLIAKMVSTIKNCKLGNLQCIRASYHSILQSGYQNWRLKSQAENGGVFWDLMIYLVSVATKLTGMPAIEIDVDFQNDENGCPVVVDLILKYEGGQSMYFTVSSLLNNSQPLIALCTEGSLILESSAMDPLALSIQPYEGALQKMQRDAENPARFSYMSFMRLLSSESEYKTHCRETDVLMNTMFEIQNRMNYSAKKNS